MLLGERMVVDTSPLEADTGYTPVEVGVEVVELQEGVAENAAVLGVVAAAASAGCRSHSSHTMPTVLEVVSVQLVAAAGEQTIVDYMPEWQLPEDSARPKLQLQPSMQSSLAALAEVEVDQVAKEAAGGCTPMGPAERKDFCA